MRALKISILTVLMTVTLASMAQVPADAPQSEFLAYTERLFKAGNDCYVEIGNKIELNRIIQAYQTALDERREAGLLSEQTADSLTYLQLYKLMGDYHYLNSDEDEDSYAKAEQYFRESMDFAKASKGYQTAYHDQYILHRELGQLYYKWEKYQEAFEEMEIALDEVSKYYSPYDDEVLDQIGQLAICRARIAQSEADFNDALEEIEFVIEEYRNTSAESYGEALRKKGKILMLKNETLQTGYIDEALKCYKEYFEMKRADAVERFATMNTEEREQYWMRIRPFVVDCYRLEDADAGFLYDVALFSKGLLLELDHGEAARFDHRWQEIQEHLKKKECVIEFVQYEKYGTQHMGALVLGKKGEPQFVHMADPDQVMHYKVGSYTVEKRLTHIHSKTDKQHINNLYSNEGLNELLWNKDLTDAIGKAHDVWFSADGYIHRMGVEYMLPKKVSGYRCHRLTSTRMLLNPRKAHVTGNALIIGGVDYSADAYADDNTNDSIAYDYLKRNRIRFSYLSNSRPEAESIYNTRNNDGDTIFVETEATEQNFKDVSSNYNIVFISTHGLFFAATVPLGTDLKPCLTDNSLSESILALSGSNRSLTDDEFVNENTDGILSAKEISQLDLSNVELVMLSCCESGLGFVTSDGVYGIQRGFKNAGVKAIIASLWDVDDETGAMFMIELNRKISKGATLYDAFQAARKKLKKYELWQQNVFILIDAI